MLLSMRSFTLFSVNVGQEKFYEYEMVSNENYFNSNIILYSQLYFTFEFQYIISLYYIRNQLHATLAQLFFNNCKKTLPVSDVYRVHHQEYINCSSSQWCMSWVWVMYIQYRRPRTSLIYIHHPDPWHAPLAATTVYVLLMMDAVNIWNR